MNGNIKQTNMEKQKYLDLEEVISELGEFGKYQRRNYFLIIPPIVLTAMQAIGMTFTGALPRNRCYVPECDSDPVNPDDFKAAWVHSAIPATGGPGNRWLLSNCERYLYDESYPGTCSPHAFTNITTTCNRYAYDQTYFTSTAVTEFNLVCDRGFYMPLASSLFMAGMLVGAVWWGYFSDRFGRKLTYMIACVTEGIVCVGVGVLPTLPAHLFLRFLAGLCNMGIFQTAFVIGVELVGKRKRMLCGLGFFPSFCIGELLFGLMAYFIRDWRTLQIVKSAPLCLFAIYYWIIPDSPRWLLAKGKWQEARDLFEKIASVNGVELPERLLPNQYTTIKLSTEKENENVTLFNALKRPVIRTMSLVIYYNWFVCAMLYYGLALNISNIEGINPYVTYSLTMAAELPGHILCFVGLDRLGRRTLLSFFMLLGGISCVAAGALYDVSVWASVAMSMLGKAGIAGSFAVAYLYTGEMFPTLIRSSAVGAGSMSARPGSILAPFIAYLGDFSLLIPFSIFGGSAIIAGILVIIFLPETLGIPLPETLEDTENLKKKKKVVTG